MRVFNLDKKICTEFDLLLTSLQSNRDPGKPQRIETLNLNNIDWVEFSRLVQRHGVQVPVYYSLIQNQTAPDDVTDNLKNSYTKNKRNNLKLSAEITYLHHIFNKEGIKAISIKGPVLSQMLYDDVFFRSSTDLDWLISAKEITRTYNHLKSLGYHATKHDFDYSKKKMEYIISKLHDFGLSHPNRRVLNEIHWCMDSNRALFPDELNQAFIERSITYDFGNLRINCLSNEDLLLYLCFHGSKHIWYQLRWLMDINEILHGALDINWTKFFAEVEKYDFQYCVMLPLELCNQYWGTAIPDLPWQKDNRSIWLLKTADKFITSKKIDLRKRGRFNGSRVAYFNARLKKNFKSSWLSYNNTLINIDDWNLINFPDKVFFLYIVVRPVFWVYRNILRVIGLWPKNR